MKYVSPQKFKKLINNKEPKILFVFENEKCAPSENEISDIYSGDSVGFDLRTNEDVIIKFDTISENSFCKTTLISTGCKWAAPSGVELEIVPRSGISLNTHLKISNTPGTIEPTYRNEIKIILDYSLVYLFSKELLNKGDKFFEHNYKDSIKISSYYLKVSKYTKFAQAKIKPTIYYFNFYGGKPIDVYFTVDKDIYENWHEICPSKRGLNGFGSTGLK